MARPTLSGWLRFESRSEAEIEADIRDELTFHIEMSTRERVDAGMEPAEARRAAVASFGDLERIRGECRSTWLGGRRMGQRIHLVFTAFLVVALLLLAWEWRASVARSERSVAALRRQVNELRSDVRSAAASQEDSLLAGLDGLSAAAAEALRRFAGGGPGGHHAVVAAGEEAIPGLVRILEGNAGVDPQRDGLMRMSAANALGAIGSTDAVDALIAALEDPFFNVRRCAALALADIGDPRAILPVRKLAEEDPYVWTDPDTKERKALVRIDARRALVELTGEAPVEDELRALRAEQARLLPTHPRWEVIAGRIAELEGRTVGDAAVDALLTRFADGDIQAYRDLVELGEPALPGLIELLGDAERSGVVRFSSANALGAIGSPGAVDALVAALGDPYFNVRRCAALALGDIGDPRAVEPLRRLAAEDPYVYRDPESGEELALVRIDATEALARLANREPASRLAPPPDLDLPDAPLPWPFPGDFRAQNLWNNYQTPTDSYVHWALDLMQPAGTPVRAVADGVVAAVATNYPDWTTHHVLAIADEEGGDVGWLYTHLDPSSYRFAVGEQVRAGEVIGELVDFRVGASDGADHLHLQRARFEVLEGGGIEMWSLADPLYWFDAPDGRAPELAGPWFTRAGTLERLGAGVLAAEVDVIAAVSDHGWEGGAGNWGVARIELVVSGSFEGAPEPWELLVLDQRGAAGEKRAVGELYLSAGEREAFAEPVARWPTSYLFRATRSDGDGVIEREDARLAWDTREWPNGEYEVTVTAFDLAGNRGEATARVVVAN